MAAIGFSYCTCGRLVNQQLWRSVGEVHGARHLRLRRGRVRRRGRRDGGDGLRRHGGHLAGVLHGHLRALRRHVAVHHRDET